MSIVLPGWTCPCGAFNGEALAPVELCRACAWRKPVDEKIRPSEAESHGPDGLRSKGTSMATKTRLTPKQRDELRAYLHDAQTAFAGMKAQSYDPKGSPSVPEHDGISDRQLASGRAHQRVHVARCTLERGGAAGGVAWGVLRLAYGVPALDDRHESKFDQEISALLRMTDAVQSEASRRWVQEERARLLGCEWVKAPREEGAFHRLDHRAPWARASEADRARLAEKLFVLPPSPGALRQLANRVIGEGRPEILYGDEVMPGAIEQAREMLAAAELAWLIALRVAEREKTAWVGR